MPVVTLVNPLENNNSATQSILICPSTAPPAPPAPPPGSPPPPPPNKPPLPPPPSPKPPPPKPSPPPPPTKYTTPRVRVGHDHFDNLVIGMGHDNMHKHNNGATSTYVH